MYTQNLILLSIVTIYAYQARVSQEELSKHAIIQHLDLLRKTTPPSPPRPHIRYQLQQTATRKIYRPVVLMHGFTSHHDISYSRIRGDITSMVHVEKWIREMLPGIYTRRIQVGNGYWDSILMPMTEQVEDFCKQVQSDPNLGYGFSQGTLVTRGYIQRCNYPPVYNYISWAGPQAGLFGIPFIDNSILDEYLGTVPYWTEVQQRLAPAQFWRDPYQLDEYLNASLFLADLNNERTSKNSTYKKHLTSLNHMALIYSINDEIINPRESGWFYFYKPGTQTLVPVQDTPLYKEDWIGLRTLDETKRLYFGQTNCTHSGHQYKDCKDFFEVHTLPFLNNTLQLRQVH